MPYHEGNRGLQDRFDTRRLADRIERAARAGRRSTTTIGPSSRAATCSSSRPRTRRAAAVLVQGRRAGLRACARRADDRIPGVRRERDVPDRRERPGQPAASACCSSISSAAARLRLNGVASVDRPGPAARRVPRGAARRARRSDARSFRTARAISTSTGSCSARGSCPRDECATPVPAWKTRDWARDVLPHDDPAHDAGRRGRRTLNRSWIALGGIVAGVGWAARRGDDPRHEWTVMTDELLYSKLARHIADDRLAAAGAARRARRLPRRRVSDPARSVLRLARPCRGVRRRARRQRGAVRQHGDPRLPPRAAPCPARDARSSSAFLSLAIPWAVNTATLMSEAAAYPAFAWTALALHGALVQPSPRRDALAIGALALAFFTRPQFLVLAAVLPLAAVVIDGPRRAFARHAPRRGDRRRRARGDPAGRARPGARLLGDYGVTATQGSLLPRRLEGGGDPRGTCWRSASVSCRCCSAPAGPTRRSGRRRSGCGHSRQ